MERILIFANVYGRTSTDYTTFLSSYINLDIAVALMVFIKMHTD